MGILIKIVHFREFLHLNTVKKRAATIAVKAAAVRTYTQIGRAPAGLLGSGKSTGLGPDSQPVFDE